MASDCECVALSYPFTCPRFGRQMNPQTHGICSGCYRHATPRETYVARWEQERRGEATRTDGADPERPAPPALHRHAAAAAGEQAALSAGPTRLTIGMAVFEDFDGWYFTPQNILVNHAEVLDRLEFITVDQRPDGEEGREIRAMIRGLDENGEIRATDGTGWIPRSRYIAMPTPIGTSAPRDRIFQEATTEAVLVLDAHVVIQRGGLSALLRWFDAHPDAPDLLHGPMLDDYPGMVHATHMLPEWGSDLMFGRWGNDSELALPGEPREIPMHGLGLFAMRRDAWPGFPPHLRGFGGEEGNLHDAVRAGGGRVLCHPDLRWLHRFRRPRNNGRPPYPCWLEDKFRNYLIWHTWLDKPVQDVAERFLRRPEQDAETQKRRLSAETIGRIRKEVSELGIRPRFVRSAQAGSSESAAPHPCIHRGAHLYQRKCPPCKSRDGKEKWVDVFACGVKRRCTPEQTGLTIPGCNVCDAREAPHANRCTSTTPRSSTSTSTVLMSVLIVTHGRYRMLREALACFLLQDHAPRELLVLNHHPRPLALGFEPPPYATVTIFNEPNEATFGANLNALLPHARGELLTTWGDDDLYLPWCLSLAASRIGDRPAWKPARSWHYHGVTHQVDQVGNNLEASIVWRTDFVRAHGFDADDATEAKRLFAALPGPLASDDVGNAASVLTTWGTGIHHLSGSIGRGTAEERHRVWRRHNQDDGGGEPLTPADVSHWWRRIAEAIPPEEREAWKLKAGL